MTDDVLARRERELAARLFHEAARAVSLVEGTIGAGLILVGACLLVLACAQERFHRGAAQQHAAASRS